MTGYDTLAFRYLGYALAYKKTAMTALVSCAFSNTIGFALLTGSAIRYRFYSAWKVPAIAIAQVIAFANFSFWLGLLAVGGLVFVLHPLAIPTQLHIAFASVRPLGIIFLLLVTIYLFGSLFSRQTLNIRGYELRFPSFQLSLSQILVSSLDWSVAATVLYTLLPATLTLSYPSFLGIYLLAMTAGVISNVPGGLGVFESVVVILLTPQISAATVLGALLAYRGVYYLLPLAVATSVLGLHEIYQRFQVRSS